MICDALMIMISIGTSFFIINLLNQSFINFRSFLTYYIYLAPILTVFYAAGLYPGIMLSPAEEVKKISICLFFCFAGIALSITVESDERAGIASGLILAIPVAAIFLPVAREFLRHFFGHFKFWKVPAVIFADENSGDVIIERLKKNRDLGYTPAVIILKNNIENLEKHKNIPIMPYNDDTFRIIEKFNVKVAVVCDFGGDLTEIRSHFRHTIIVPHNADSNALNMALRDFGGILAVSTLNHHTKTFELFLKRTFDICASLLVILFFGWLYIALMIIVKLTSKGPVFYGHKRVGKNGKEFRCWKFRSMVIDAEEQLKKILAEDPVRAAEWEKDRKFTDDPRVTKIGKFLRKTSLDELPQIFNILNGTMSFIGPRPVTEGELEKYGNKRKYVLSVTPGLSGMWQVSGRSDTVYEERVTLDSYYVQNWSIWLDMWILVRTVWVVLLGKGAY